MTKSPYTSNFYNTYLDESRGSARSVLPHVFELVKPHSVIDVGCGVGTWLSVCLELGVSDVLGVDGDYVDKKQLLISADNFASHDLSVDLKLDRQFDLAMSLEVAEHIPKECAQTFVRSLTGLAPVVLFSAAPPFQGGDHHVNEQWPEYWVELFDRCGFSAYDYLRPLIWDDESVAYYYSQNAFIYVQRDQFHRFSDLASRKPVAKGLSRIHPRKWLEANDPRRQTLRSVLRAFPYALVKAIRLRLRQRLK